MENSQVCLRKVRLVKEKIIEVGKLLEKCKDYKQTNAELSLNNVKFVNKLSVVSKQYLQLLSEKQVLNDSVTTLKSKISQSETALAQSELEIVQLRQVIEVYKVDRQEYGREKVDSLEQKLQKAVAEHTMLCENLKKPGFIFKSMSKSFECRFRKEIRDFKKNGRISSLPSPAWSTASSWSESGFESMMSSPFSVADEEPQSQRTMETLCDEAFEKPLSVFGDDAITSDKNCDKVVVPGKVFRLPDMEPLMPLAGKNELPEEPVVVGFEAIETVAEKTQSLEKETQTEKIAITASKTVADVVTIPVRKEDVPDDEVSDLEIAKIFESFKLPDLLLPYSPLDIAKPVKKRKLDAATQILDSRVAIATQTENTTSNVTPDPELVLFKHFKMFMKFWKRRKKRAPKAGRWTVEQIGEIRTPDKVTKKVRNVSTLMETLFEEEKQSINENTETKSLESDQKGEKIRKSPRLLVLSKSVAAKGNCDNLKSLGCDKTEEKRDNSDGKEKFNETRQSKRLSAKRQLTALPEKTRKLKSIIDVGEEPTVADLDEDEKTTESACRAKKRNLGFRGFDSIAEPEKVEDEKSDNKGERKMESVCPAKKRKLVFDTIAEPRKFDDVVDEKDGNSDGNESCIESPASPTLDEISVEVSPRWAPSYVYEPLVNQAGIDATGSEKQELIKKSIFDLPEIIPINNQITPVSIADSLKPGPNQLKNIISDAWRNCKKSYIARKTSLATEPSLKPTFSPCHSPKYTFNFVDNWEERKQLKMKPSVLHQHIAKSPMKFINAEPRIVSPIHEPIVRTQSTGNLFTDLLANMEKPPSIPHPVAIKKETKKKKKKTKKTKIIERPCVPAPVFKSEDDKIAWNALETFLTAQNVSNDAAAESLRVCVNALNGITDDTILVRTVTKIVMENVDETPDAQFSPSAPPLTLTQHRLFALFASYNRFSKMFHDIIDELISLMVPDRFIMPDDSVESCGAFIGALFRYIDDSAGAVKFCVEVAAEMRQRGSLVINAVLAAWPEILPMSENADSWGPGATAAMLIMSIPSPTRERQINSLRKLKNLLNGYYGYEREVNLVDWSKKAIDALRKGDMTAARALSAIAPACDAWSIIAPLLESLGVWEFAGIADAIALRMLDILTAVLTKLGNNSKTRELRGEAIKRIGDILLAEKVSIGSQEEIVKMISRFSNGKNNFLNILMQWKQKKTVSPTIHKLITSAAMRSKQKKKKKKKNVLACGSK